MKLNLGCGIKKWPGFVNCDIRDSDHDCDIRKLPFEDESASEIHAIHVCEHFFITEIATVLKEWKRVLKPAGRLFVELPCWDKVKVLIADGAPENMTRWALYGQPETHIDGVPALHKWCWGKNEFGRLLVGVGFSKVIMDTPKFHVPGRDMRWEAVK